MAQKTKKGYFSLAEQIASGIKSGAFPENIRIEFRRMLEYFGQAPIIVRSSSLLEDGFGNAFAGKYESVFCANQGDIGKRLENLEEAIKIVYASTVDASALEYREVRGLQNQDEQMSILVQRVSGSFHGRYFFPSASGVGYSYDTYGLNKKVDPRRGMLRMVIGLGTRAVERTDSDYPRIIHIGNPRHSYLSTVDERVRFSQKKVDVIDLENNRVAEIGISKLLGCSEKWYQNLVIEHDLEMERSLRECGMARQVCFGTCIGYTKNKLFLSDMERILSVLQEEYTYPVDIEFTVNSSSRNEHIICLLQCRPLQVYSGEESISIPDIPHEDTLFKVKNSSMGIPQSKTIDNVIVVDPKAYYEYPYNKKPEIGHILTELNAGFKGSGKTVMLVVPGRIGTSSPELGVPVKFAGISNYSVIVEVDDRGSGYAPELSFGSHLFQDLVEAKIFYTAIFGNSREETLRRTELLKKMAEPYVLPKKYFSAKNIVSVYDTSQNGLTLYYDVVSQTALCAFS